MIISLFFYLLLMGGVAVIYRGIRFQKILSLGTCIAALGLAIWFAWAGYHQIFDKYSYAWLTSKSYPVNLDFFAQSSTYGAVLVPLALTLLAMIYTFSDHMEKYKFFLNGLYLLNLAALILMLCAHNNLQTLLGACFIDVIGFCAINNVQARRRYIFYNLLTDTALFVAFAILWGECHTNIITQLSQCHSSNRELALSAIMAAAFIKIGLFPFQGYILPAAVLNESRRALLSYLSTPLSGFIILYQFQPQFLNVLSDSPWLTTASLLSIIWGTIGAVLMKHVADKKLYINLVFYGLAYDIIAEFGGQYMRIIAMLWGLHILLSYSLAYTRKNAWASTATILIIFAAIMLETNLLPQNTIIWSYRVGILFALGVTGSQIHSQAREENSLFNLGMTSMSAAVVISRFPEYSPNDAYLLLALGILLALRPYRWLQKSYNSSALQTADILSKTLYIIFAGPLHFLGRVLWLTVDFVIIERTILNSLTKINEWFASLLKKFHIPSIWNSLIFAVLGGIILVYGVVRGTNLWK